MVSARGGKYGFVYRHRQRVYKALRRQGKSKTVAAKIANGGRTHVQRSRMSRKGARTRRAKRGKL
jgi:hypothetical protein